MRDNREVLLGVRSKKHVFMPDVFVFPGGRVDPGDARVACPVGLRPNVEQRLEREMPTSRARALAMTAVRETFEEVGLILGDKVAQPPSSRSPHWQPFFATGHVPALDKLDYIARAITPVGNVRRFDARFFLVDARHLHGSVNGNGELLDLQWVPLEKVQQLPLSPITAIVLQEHDAQLRAVTPDTNVGDIPIYS
jgi:8-oxo-dGTP pyrophosphatase MutT (NUDIX family)